MLNVKIFNFCATLQRLKNIQLSRNEKSFWIFISEKHFTNYLYILLFLNFFYLSSILTKIFVLELEVLLAFSLSKAVTYMWGCLMFCNSNFMLCSLLSY